MKSIIERAFESVEVMSALALGIGISLGAMMGYQLHEQTTPAAVVANVTMNNKAQISALAEEVKGMKSHIEYVNDCVWVYRMRLDHVMWVVTNGKRGLELNDSDFETLIKRLQNQEQSKAYLDAVNRYFVEINKRGRHITHYEHRAARAK